MVVVFNGKLLRQPDDPGVEETNPAARPFDWRLIISLFVLQLAIIGAFAWVVWR